MSYIQCCKILAEELQYDLLNVLYGCKMALRTLDFSQVKPTIAMLRERRARAPEAAWARFPWCDRKARCACFAVTQLRYYVVMGPWKQRSFHRYSYYRANSVTHSVHSHFFKGKSTQTADFLDSKKSMPKLLAKM